MQISAHKKIKAGGDANDRFEFANEKTSRGLYKAGNFLETVHECAIQDHKSRDELPADPAALHNDGVIDIVTEFGALENNGAQGKHFFSTRRIFEKTLPQLNAQVSAVMHCALGLVRKAGQDMAASWILGGFVDFCVKVPSRTQDALKEVEKNPDNFADMLPAIIASGMKIDIPYFIGEVIRLSKHPDIRIRRGVIYSIAWIPWSEENTVTDSVFVVLEEVVADDEDDQILANALSSAFSLMQQDEKYRKRTLTIISDTLVKGNDLTLYAASTVFCSHTEKIQPPLLELLISHLEHTNPAHKGIVDNIDCGIAHLFKSDMDKAVQFLEKMLLASPDTLALESFDSVISEIRANSALISKIVTRWFLSGERVLCDGVHEIIGEHYGEDLIVNIDNTEIKQSDFTHMVFIARKAIGYLFMKPITVSSIIISLMRYTQDAEILQHLGELLFNPLLLNYPGALREFLKKQSDVEVGKTKEMIDKALNSIEEYLNDLRNIPELPALHPSQAQRESYHRYMSELMAKSRESAERESIVLNLFSRSTLLYGHKAIYYVYTTVDDPPKRSEMKMASHSVEMEFPRMDNLDPYGVDHMIRIFRAERIVA